MVSKRVRVEAFSESLTRARDDDRDDKAVDTEDTSHDHGDDGLDDQLGLKHCDRADTDAGLGSTVSCAHVSENESAHDAHTSEEKSLVGITVHYENAKQSEKRSFEGSQSRKKPRKDILSAMRAFDRPKSGLSGRRTYKELG